VVDSMVGEKSIESDCCEFFLHYPIATKPQIVETRHSKGHGMIYFLVHSKRITQNTIQYNNIIISLFIHNATCGKLM